MGDEGKKMEVDRAISCGTSTEEPLPPDLQMQVPEQATLIDADEVELLPEDSNLEGETGLELSTPEPYSELSPEVESSPVGVGDDAIGSTLQPAADLASETNQSLPDVLPPNGLEESPPPPPFVLPPVDVLQERTTLKNARVGVEFLEPLGIEGLVVHLVEQPVIDSGLRIDLAGGVLCGTPTVAGDFEWKVTGLRDGSRVELMFRVAVIPDPRSLWKNLPSDRQDGFWKLDEVAEVLDGEIYCVAASKRGRSHAHEGGFRDDHFDMITGPGGWHVVAVADGAGSAKFSRQGSKVAIEYVIRNLPGKMATSVSPRLGDIVALCEGDLKGNSHSIRTILYGTLVDVAFGAAKAVETEAKNRGHEPGDYSTTMIMAAVTKIDGGWFIASFSVGDGGAAILDLESNEVTVMTTPDSGEFAGQTRFLRSSEFSDSAKSMERIHFAVRPTFTAMALMTDGITDPKFPTDLSFAEFDQWRSFWIDDLSAAVDFTRGNGAVARVQLLSWMDFWSDGNHDDRTIAILLP
jgi:hypothetical protein